MRNNLPEQDGEPPTPAFATGHAGWHRLQNQLDWYDRKSQHCQRWYKRLKIAQVALAVLIPTTTLLPGDAPKWASSIAGCLIAVLEAIQQINQYSTLWVTYRSTAERLKHEKYLFLSAAGPYKGLPEPDRLVALAERIEEHVSAEHANWISDARRVSSGQKPEVKTGP